MQIELDYIKELSKDYVKQNEKGLFYIPNYWDREEAKSYNVDYHNATSYFKTMINNLNKGG
ncbi:hypothetical protein [Caudoviricetes sp.]|nr:MAG: hypothetical protein [Podoviridae sp. ct2cs2]UOF77544.1 hypothetical protein [Caudoviricetes sp.]